MGESELLTPREALAAWGRRIGAGVPLEPCEDGLINRTFIAGAPPFAVLQWVNPIFDPRIQDDIAAVTEALASAGLLTPRLIETDDGAFALQDERGFWRLLSYVPGSTYHRLESVPMAASVGRLVGRFHRVLADTGPKLSAPPRRIHQTTERLAELRRALEAADGHPLAGPARELGEAILGAFGSWQGGLDLPERLCHGDLKVSNIRFTAAPAPEAACLLDLDTLGPQDLSAEMGDAWRSWCNPAPEDRPEAARLDLELFTASARGWLAEAPPLSAEERESLVAGIERISLELAARFCADALCNDYFREDRRRFPRPGDHNLLRARAQLALAGSARRQRAACERALWHKT